MATIKDLYAALNGDVAETQAVTDAQATLAAATTAATAAATTLTDAEAALATAQAEQQADIDGGGDGAAFQDAVDAATAAVDTATTEKATADAAVVDAEAALATAQSNVDVGDSIAIAAELSITDFGMVSNDMARAILAARGEEVKFEEPEDVKSDYYMNPIA